MPLSFSFFTRKIFDEVAHSDINKDLKLSLFSEMSRYNALIAVKRAGSGHLGSSFSSLDIVTFLYAEKMNTLQSGYKSLDRDIYFSSKGHDCPGLYAVLYGFGVLPEEMLFRLRRAGGAHGHPDVSISGIEANSGSLGMGISKAKGIAQAKQMMNKGGLVYVMTGDGELQEGQNYEALQTAISLGVSNLRVIVDHNKVQSDRPIKEICDLGNLEEKICSFGWNVVRCDGHDFQSLREAFIELDADTSRPGLLIADTIKGRGVSFMEHPEALRTSKGLYLWHSGAPDNEHFLAASDELLRNIFALFEKADIRKPELGTCQEHARVSSGVSSEYISEAFGLALAELGEKYPNIVVLDADLEADCKLRAFSSRFPNRFIEQGICEQDMVSTAGGLALQGILPVVNSFAAFLASRANEQIYTNAGEGTRIIYVCHYAGLIPAGPGKSHQSLRDISLLSSMPGMEILQPCCAVEAKMALRYAVEKASQNIVLRINIGPSPIALSLPPDYKLERGRGISLNSGNDGILFAYGPVMLHEALHAVDILSTRGYSLEVVNMPWLNTLDVDWFSFVTKDKQSLFVLEDHHVRGGLGDFLLSRAAIEGFLGRFKICKIFGVDGLPCCGTPTEALKAHGLDGESIANIIANS